MVFGCFACMAEKLRFRLVQARLRYVLDLCLYVYTSWGSFLFFLGVYPPTPLPCLRGRRKGRAKHFVLTASPRMLLSIHGIHPIHYPHLARHVSRSLSTSGALYFFVHLLRLAFGTALGLNPVGVSMFRF